MEKYEVLKKQEESRSPGNASSLLAMFKKPYSWQNFKSYLGSNMGNRFFILQCFKGSKNFRFGMDPV